MIYHYYCTNCGHKIPGEEVVFNLAEILELNTGKSGGNLFIKISPADLYDLASENKVSLHEGAVRLKLSIARLLSFLGQDFSKTIRKQLSQLSYSEFEKGTSISNLFAATFANSEAAEESIEDLISNIQIKFELEDKTDENISDEEWEENTENYTMSFWIQAMFFEGQDTIYTISSSTKEDPSDLRSIKYMGKDIRGYCPKCCKPIALGSGMYEHILVGFLGAQSAGKTSLFISMINYLKNHYDDEELQFGINRPEELCDGRYVKTDQALKANTYGWAVGKTNAAKTTQEAYNATVMLEKKGKKVLLTFVDIAGEYCWNGVGFDQDALDAFPLITWCHMYMLCEDILPQNEDIGAAELIIMAKDLYRYIGRHRQGAARLVKPPLCLTVTKADVVKIQGGLNEGQRNPFSDIGKKFQGKLGFNAKQEVQYLERIYASTQNQLILDSLRACVRTYNELKEITYVSMIGCSAQGMDGLDYGELKKKVNEEIAEFIKNVHEKQGIVLTEQQIQELLEKTESRQKKRLEEEQNRKIPEERWRKQPEAMIERFLQQLDAEQIMAFREEHGVELDAEQLRRMRVPNFYRDGARFRSMNLDKVWKWILCNIGMISSYNGYCFSTIPSYGEAYGGFGMESDKVLMSYPLEEEENRVNGVLGMYLNPTKLDVNLNVLDMDKPTRPIIRSIDMPRYERERRRIIEGYIQNYGSKEG
jgi:hypothetical protein